jgi:hypothetical protein
MGTQRHVAAQITEQGGNYALALGEQPEEALPRGARLLRYRKK